MADKEKLVDLINDVLRYQPWGEVSSYTANEIANELIANGVVIQQEQFRDIPKMVTNADRIRAMSDEELAKLLCSLRSCRQCRWGGWVCGLRDWLKQPAEEVDKDA